MSPYAYLASKALSDCSIHGSPQYHIQMQKILEDELKKKKGIVGIKTYLHDPITRCDLCLSEKPIKAKYFEEINDDITVRVITRSKGNQKPLLSKPPIADSSTKNDESSTSTSQEVEETDLEEPFLPGPIFRFHPSSKTLPPENLQEDETNLPEDMEPQSLPPVEEVEENFEEEEPHFELQSESSPNMVPETFTFVRDQTNPRGGLYPVIFPPLDEEVEKLESPGLGPFAYFCERKKGAFDKKKCSVYYELQMG